MEWRDRHSEHVGQEQLCEHGDFDLYPDDRFRGTVMLDESVIAEVELEYIERGRVRITVNQLSYLINKRIADGIRDARDSPV